MLLHSPPDAWLPSYRQCGTVASLAACLALVRATSFMQSCTFLHMPHIAVVMVVVDVAASLDASQDTIS